MKYKNPSIGIACAIIATTSLLSAIDAGAQTIAYWQFESGALTVDSSGNGNTLVNTGVASSASVPTQATAFSNGSASFNGSSFFQTASGLTLSPYSQLTIEFFYNANTSATQLIFETGPNYGLAPGGIATYTQAGNIEGGIRSYTLPLQGFSYDRITGAPSSTWTHYAIEINLLSSPADQVQLFINGVAAGATVEENSSAAAFFDGTFNIGSRGGTTLFYTGLVDEFRISNGLLDPSQFLYNVPEPSSTLLLGLSGVAFTVLRMRNRTRRNS